MSIGIKILDQRIVSPLVWNEKSRAYLASVWIMPLTRIEKHIEDFIVNVIDRVLERDEN